MKKVLQFFLVLMPAVAVVLNALPSAVQMNWMGGHSTYCSGFSMLPVGYANWGPMIAGIGAIVLCVLGVICAVTQSKRAARWIWRLGIFSCVMRAGFGFLLGITGAGVAMCISLVADAVIGILFLKYQ